MANLTRYEDCIAATMQPDGDTYGLIKDACIITDGEAIVWVGSRQDLPASYASADAVSLSGRLVTPALIDCHTHLVFGGNRAAEFEQRLNGVSYEEISRRGGGIRATVAATRAASFDDLLSSGLQRLDQLIQSGVGVVEIKSGYGLSVDHEIRMLRVARELAKRRDVKIVTTWLAAHALPAEYADNREKYINEVVIEGLWQARTEGLVDAVDGFCETIGFSPDEITKIFDVARDLDLPIKLHAEQLSDQKAALLTVQYNSLSADHLEFLNPSDVGAFAESGCVAVLLPGAFYTLRQDQAPPVAALREHGVPIAIATDCNPGSSPVSSILMVMNMACTLFSLTPEEALIGVTRNAAKALGLEGTHGSIQSGASSHLAVWSVNDPAELSYWIGATPFNQFIN